MPTIKPFIPILPKILFKAVKSYQGTSTTTPLDSKTSAATEFALSTPTIELHGQTSYVEYSVPTASVPLEYETSERVETTSSDLSTATCTTITALLTVTNTTSTVVSVTTTFSPPKTVATTATGTPNLNEVTVFITPLPSAINDMPANSSFYISSAAIAITILSSVAIITFLCACLTYYHSLRKIGNKRKSFSTVDPYSNSVSNIHSSSNSLAQWRAEPLIPQEIHQLDSTTPFSLSQHLQLRQNQFDSVAGTVRMASNSHQSSENAESITFFNRDEVLEVKEYGLNTMNQIAIVDSSVIISVPSSSASSHNILSPYPATLRYSPSLDMFIRDF
jgi:hypothetical protein